VNISTRTHRIAVVVATIGALLVLAGSARATSSKPTGMSKAEYRALVIRSDALNKTYHLGKYSRIPQSMSAAEYHALLLRSKALNTQYGLGKPPTQPIVTVSAADGFAWSAFGIGAAAMAGLALLAGGAVAGGRYGLRARTSS
jgi:hypothetical protein